MSDSLATSRLLQRRTGGPRTSEVEELDDLGCFGWLRGVRDHALMLELRKRSGDILAIGYGWLERAEFDPSEGIKLYVAGRTVQVNGRNLNGSDVGLVSLYEGITRHRVPWIRETVRAELLVADQTECIVDLIKW